MDKKSKVFMITRLLTHSSVSIFMYMEQYKRPASVPYLYAYKCDVIIQLRLNNQKTDNYNDIEFFFFGRKLYMNENSFLFSHH